MAARREARVARMASREGVGLLGKGENQPADFLGI
jgi:hypothetical protein